MIAYIKDIDRFFELDEVELMVQSGNISQYKRVELMDPKDGQSLGNFKINEILNKWNG